VPALFNKVTLFSLSDVRSVVLCSVGLKYMDPTAGRAQVLKATTKKGVNFFEKKSAFSQLLCPPPPPFPNVKSWLRACTETPTVQFLMPHVSTLLLRLRNVMSVFVSWSVLHHGIMSSFSFSVSVDNRSWMVSLALEVNQSINQSFYCNKAWQNAHPHKRNAVTRAWE